MKNNREIPDLQEFLSFLESKFLAYETVKSCQKDSFISQKQYFNKPYNKSLNGPNNNYKPYNNKFNFMKKSTLLEGNKEISKTFHASYGQCPFCSGDHVLMRCDKFLDLDCASRNKTVAKLNVCKNCLYSHGYGKCNSPKTCKDCNAKHHTLLHMNKYNTETSRQFTGNDIQPRPSTSTQ